MRFPFLFYLLFKLLLERHRLHRNILGLLFCILLQFSAFCYTGTKDEFCPQTVGVKEFNRVGISKNVFLEIFWMFSSPARDTVWNSFYEVFSLNMSPINIPKYITCNIKMNYIKLANGRPTCSCNKHITIFFCIIYILLFVQYDLFI